MTTIEQPRNGVDLAAVADLAHQIAGNPCAAATVWRAEVEWKGSFRSEAKIRDFPRCRPTSRSSSRAPTPLRTRSSRYSPLSATASLSATPRTPRLRASRSSSYTSS